jgi:hypothetical protein
MTTLLFRFVMPASFEMDPAATSVDVNPAVHLDIGTEAPDDPWKASRGDPAHDVEGGRIGGNPGHGIDADTTVKSDQRIIG